MQRTCVNNSDHQDNNSGLPGKMGRAVTAAVILVTGVACLAAGFLLGWFLSHQAATSSEKSQGDGETQEETRARLIQEIKAENIEDNLRLE